MPTMYQLEASPAYKAGYEAAMAGPYSLMRCVSRATLIAAGDAYALGWYDAQEELYEGFRESIAAAREAR